jgi:hypothetical protein
LLQPSNSQVSECKQIIDIPPQEDAGQKCIPVFTGLLHAKIDIYFLIINWSELKEEKYK